MVALIRSKPVTPHPCAVCSASRACGEPIAGIRNRGADNNTNNRSTPAAPRTAEPIARRRPVSRVGLRNALEDCISPMVEGKTAAARPHNAATR